MSGLLKAEMAETRSRPFATPGAATGLPAASPANPFAAYEQKITELEAELAALELSIPDRIERAREEGREAGLQERDHSTAKKLELIQSGVGQALAGWTDKLEAMDLLSVQIARTVLQKMIGNPDWHGDFLARAIAARLAALDASTVVAVRLSPQDVSAAEIAQLNGSSKVLIEVGRDLEAGQCVMALTMGEIELGPSAQWREAAALLDRIADQPC